MEKKYWIWSGFFWGVGCSGFFIETSDVKIFASLIIANVFLVAGMIVRDLKK